MAKPVYVLLGIAVFALGIFLMQTGYSQLPSFAIYVDQSATYITYGQTVTFTAQADWTGGSVDYYNWVLDDVLVVVNDVGVSSTYTTPSDLALGQHTVECTDYTGQTSGVLYIVVGAGQAPTPTPSGFSAVLSPSSVSLVPGITQTVSLTLNGGYPAFTVYWILDGDVRSTVTINGPSANYQLPSNLPVGMHTLKVEAVDFTQDHAVSNTVAITVSNHLPTPSHSPTSSTSPSASYSPSYGPSPSNSATPPPVPQAGAFALFVAGILSTCAGIALMAYGALSGKRRGKQR